MSRQSAYPRKATIKHDFLFIINTFKIFVIFLNHCGVNTHANHRPHAMVITIYIYIIVEIIITNVPTIPIVHAFIY
jgi:hypothetical protein